jgi:hypothetical protein
MSENVNRNKCPIPSPVNEVERKTKDQVDKRWSETIGRARVEIATRAIDRDIEAEFEVNDPWMEE